MIQKKLKIVFFLLVLIFSSFIKSSLAKALGDHSFTDIYHYHCVTRQNEPIEYQFYIEQSKKENVFPYNNKYECPLVKSLMASFDGGNGLTHTPMDSFFSLSKEKNNVFNVPVIAHRTLLKEFDSQKETYFEDDVIGYATSFDSELDCPMFFKNEKLTPTFKLKRYINKEDPLDVIYILDESLQYLSLSMAKQYFLDEEFKACTFEALRMRLGSY